MRTQVDYSRKQQVYAKVTKETSDKVLIAYSDTENAVDIILNQEQAVILAINISQRVDINKYQRLIEDSGISIKKEDEN
ncbi:hypothetical protein [Paenibacillus dakarensis]|uniref:hypothetical protein n=1 Tax=Paenibacillus dakarensis TaxID=1527293 RepID=UPI0006D59857|nr:hypothetical protein [Paenibacillus dakarensis]